MPALCRMSDAQFRRAKKLIRRLCANYDGGNCLPLDDGDTCPCPQMITPTLICKYFRAAVLPSDRELWTEIVGGVHHWKRCVLCGSRFLPRSNRAAYCDGCARQEARRRTRDRVRRYRGRLYAFGIGKAFAFRRFRRWTGNACIFFHTPPKTRF